MTSKPLPEVEHIALTTFKVLSQKGDGGYYLVNIREDKTIKCGCKAGAWGNLCVHVRAVAVHLESIAGQTDLVMPTPSVRSTGRKGYRSMHAVAPAKPTSAAVRPYDGPADPFDGLAS